ncbi:MAG: hypothetical protein ACYC09_13470 [Bacteroidota bacterium]
MLWLCSIGFAADTVLPRSHRGILHRLTQETIVAAMENGLSLPDALVVTIQHSPLNDAVRSAIPRPFLEKKIDVYFSPDSADTILMFSLDEAALTYGTPFSTSFLGSKKVERTISVQADITLLTKSAQKILFSSEFTRSVTDTVMLSEINLLDDPSVPFTAVVLPATSFFDSIVEPAIITIASAVAVYLFFTIRS